MMSDKLLPMLSLVFLVSLCQVSFAQSGDENEPNYRDQVQTMYVAYYGRPGDAGGLDYWASELEKVNGKLLGIIDAFGNSKEFQNRFGDLDDQELVNNLYRQMLGRDADSGGLNFYVTALREGRFTLATIALNVADGTQNLDEMIKANKLRAANAFTEAYVEAGAAYGEFQIDDAKLWLAEVDSTAASITAALDRLPGLLEMFSGGTPLEPEGNPAPENQHIWRGVDLSYVNELEDCGAVYRFEGKIAEPYRIFAAKGANLVRLRLWHNPDWTEYSTLADVTRSIRRARQHEMAVLLDFHYSDDWAHPGKQIIPAAWRTANTTEELAQRLHDYTYETLMALNTLDLLPEYVQVGNEINTELLVTEELAEGVAINWKRNAVLLNAGISAVRRAAQETRATILVMLHIAQPENVERWVDAAAASGTQDFDIIGISYYSEWSKMPFQLMEREIRRLRHKYEKDVVIVETAYPWTVNGNDAANNLLGNDSLINGYPLTIDGQSRQIIDLMKAVLKGGGLGLVYWEPAWISSRCNTRWGQGSHWENAALFDYDGAELHRGADFLSHDYSSETKSMAKKNH